MERRLQSELDYGATLKDCLACEIFYGLGHLTQTQRFGALKSMSLSCIRGGCENWHLSEIPPGIIVCMLRRLSYYIFTGVVRQI